MCFASLTDSAKIQSVTSSAARSWIGQTVTFKCVSDGVPTPTLTWYKPDGTELNKVTAKESTVEEKINDAQDFGEYKCVTFNGVDPSNDASILLARIRMFWHIFQSYTKMILGGKGSDTKSQLQKSLLSVNKTLGSL